MSRSLAVWATFLATVALACALLANGTWLAGAAAATDSGGMSTLTGKALLIADLPGASAAVITRDGAVPVAGLASELKAADIGSRDTVTVRVRPAATQAGAANLVRQQAVPGTATLVAEASPRAEAATSRAGTTVTHSVTLVRASWPGMPIENAPTFEQLDRAAADSGAYWRQTSEGQLDFAVTTRIANLEFSASPCALFVDAFYEAIEKSGFQEVPNANLVVGFPHCTEGAVGNSLAWASVADTPAEPGVVFLNGPNAVRPDAGGTVAATLGHEWGHNLALEHANEVTCGSAGVQVVDAGIGACRNIEYGGVYSIMGAWFDTAPALDPQHRFELGFMNNSSLTDVLPQSVDHSFTISPAGLSTGRRYLRVTDTQNNAYYLEYRTAVGLDAQLLSPDLLWPVPPGVVVSKVFPNPAGTPFGSGTDDYGEPAKLRDRTSYLLDANPPSHPYAPDPLTTDNFEGNPVLNPDTPLQLGDTTVTVKAQSPEGATIEVSFPPGHPPATVPAAPGKPQARVLSGGGQVAVEVTWPQTSSYGGAYITDYTVTANPGGETCQIRLARICYFQSLTPDLPYTFTATATNAVGASLASAASTPVTIPPAPRPTAISPSSGPTTGGTQVRISGTGFRVGATVAIGGTACTSVTVTSATALTCRTGAHAAGVTDVVVTNSDTQTSTLARSFSYRPPVVPPTITTVTPASGPTSGHTRITVTGSGFAGGVTSVTVGGNRCTSIRVTSIRSLSCDTARHVAGSAAVVVATRSGTATRPNAFRYTKVGQLPVKACALVPATLPAAGAVPLTSPGCITTSGAPVAVTVPGCRVLVRGDLRGCRLVTRGGGTMLYTGRGQPNPLVVTWSAPGNGYYLPMSYTRSYRR